MSYLTKRKLILSDVLGKKSTVEQVLSELKAKREIEETKLGEVLEQLQDATQVLSESDLALVEIANGLEGYEQAVKDRLTAALETLRIAERTIDQLSSVIKLLDQRILVKLGDLENIKKEIFERFEALSQEDARLERKRTDIGIYEDRLRKKLKEASLDDIIKIVFE